MTNKYKELLGKVAYSTYLKHSISPIKPTWENLSENERAVWIDVAYEIRMCASC